MSKVIDIEDRLKLEQKKKARVDKAKKMEAVRKVVQCTRCMARCAKCGMQFETPKCINAKRGLIGSAPFARRSTRTFSGLPKKARRAHFTGTTGSGWPCGRPGSITRRP